MVLSAAAEVPPSVLAIPLALTPEGRFNTTDTWDGLAKLIEVMFATSSETWPHAPWFGLHELVSGRGIWGSEIQERLNEALARLNVTWVRVGSVADPESNASGQRVFRIAFDAEDRHSHTSREIVAA